MVWYRNARLFSPLSTPSSISLLVYRLFLSAVILYRSCLALAPPALTSWVPTVCWQTALPQNAMSSDRLLADSLTTNCNVFCCSLPYYVTSSVAQSALSVRTSVTSTRLNILINHVTQATMVSNGSTYSHSDTSNVIRFVGSSYYALTCTYTKEFWGVFYNCALFTYHVSY